MQRWTVCTKHHVHWGALGGAGLLFHYTSQDGETTYLLTQRSRWADEGGSWGVPGGAIQDGESAEAAARRETREEIGVLPSYHVTSIEVQDCGGGWTFHLIHAAVDNEFLAYSVLETDATGWFTLDNMLQLHLHPGMAKWFDRQDPRSNRSWRSGRVQ